MPFALALVAAVGALRSRRTASAKVTAEERLGEQRCASVGSGGGRVFCKASGDAQAKVVAEAELSSEQPSNSGSKAFYKLVLLSGNPRF